ncbi:MAG: hypothetical protein ACRECH_11550 [Nitrososphaerales archaeon]
MSEHDKDKKEHLPTAEDLFTGRGSPAFMSTKEPAIRLLRERYSESFAITVSASMGQTYLFLIKTGLWALVSTFTRRDYNGDSQHFGVPETLEIIGNTLEGKNENSLARMDTCVKNAIERIQRKIAEFKVGNYS